MSYKCFKRIGVHKPNVIKLSKNMWLTTIKPKLDQQTDNLNANEILSFLVREIGEYTRTFPYYDELNLRPIVKDDAKASLLRTKGNELFYGEIKSYIDAIVYYNQSIAHSAKGSQERAIAYANRSAVCIQLGRYDDCLENIRLARESNYPARLMMKLNMREVVAMSAQTSDAATRRVWNDAEQEQQAEEIQLSYPAHEKVPQMVKHLKLLRSDAFGRHVVADQPLKAGDVVLIEKPYATVLSECMKHIRCAHCHAEKTFVLIPCEGCTEAMYCSQQCLRAAWQQYHRYECPILSIVWQLGTEYLAMTVRTITVALGAFDHNVEAIRNHLSHLDVSKVNAFEMDWNVVTPKDIYETVYALATNQTKRHAKDLALQVLVATITHELLLKRTAMGSVCNADPILQKALFHLILHHLLGTLINHHFLDFLDYQPDQLIYNPEVYAMACFPLLSMFNHSCAPNVKRITLRDGRCALIVTRPITAGTQLFDDYDAHHWILPRDQRQTILIHLYRFLCRCEACEKDYGNMSWYNNYNRQGLSLYMNIHRALELHQQEKVKQSLPLLQTCLNDLGQFYPDGPTVISTCQLICCYQVLYTSMTSLSNYR